MTESNSLLGNSTAEPTQAAVESPNPTETAPATPVVADPAATPVTGEPAKAPTEDSKVPAVEKKETESKPAQAQVGAPEKYDAFSVGENAKLDDAKAKEFEAVARELNLSQTAAQRLVDLQSKFVSDNQQAINAEYERTTAQWKEESIKHMGPNYKEELAKASKAIDRFGTPQLREFFDKTSIGNHPEMTKFFVKIGKAISEDTFTEGRAGGVGPKSDAEILYPTHK